MQFDRFSIYLHEIPASPTRRLCMEYNKKIIAAKLNPSGDNSEYQEETENDIEDDDDVYMEQNLTDVSYCCCSVSVCMKAFLSIVDSSAALADHLRKCV